MRAFKNKFMKIGRYVCATLLFRSFQWIPRFVWPANWTKNIHFCIANENKQMWSICQHKTWVPSLSECFPNDFFLFCSIFSSQLTHSHNIYAINLSHKMSNDVIRSQMKWKHCIAGRSYVIPIIVGIWLTKVFIACFWIKKNLKTGKFHDHRNYPFDMRHSRATVWINVDQYVHA